MKYALQESERCTWIAGSAVLFWRIGQELLSEGVGGPPALPRIPGGLCWPHVVPPVVPPVLRKDLPTEKLQAPSCCLTP